MHLKQKQYASRLPLTQNSSSRVVIMLYLYIRGPLVPILMARLNFLYYFSFLLSFLSYVWGLILKVRRWAHYLRAGLEYCSTCLKYTIQYTCSNNKIFHTKTMSIVVMGSAKQRHIKLFSTKTRRTTIQKVGLATCQLTTQILQHSYFFLSFFSCLQLF